MRVIWWTFLFVTTAITCASTVRYDNYKVFRVWPSNQEQIQCLHALSKRGEHFHFWNGVRKVNSSVDIMISPKRVQQFTNFALAFNLHNELVMNNVQKHIDEQHNLAQSGDTEFGWTNYYRLEAIYGWLDSLVRRYPKIVTPITAGRSFEGRLIRGVKVAFSAKKSGVIFESGIHASEWIGPATSTYILNQILTSSDKTIREIAENYVWFFVPVVNPDGYVYSHTTDRFWRKTRSDTGNTCFGADPNRNWDIDWGDDFGIQNNPCNRNYPGWRPFSETETRTFSEYLSSIANQIDTYFSFHSFGQMLCFPYAFTERHVDNYNLMANIALNGAKALYKKYGTLYKTGSIIDTIYAARGSSIDWVKRKLNISFPFVYELRDTGRYGLLLPPEQIIPTGKETLDSVIAILQEILKVVQ